VILITAATGQVGSAALNALVAVGAEVPALVRDPTAFAAPEGVDVVQGDDNTSIAKALRAVAFMVLVAGQYRLRDPASPSTDPGSSGRAPRGPLFRRSIENNRTIPLTHFHLVAAWANVGKLEKTQSEVEQALRFKMRWSRTPSRRNAPAGVPEG
jgi:uncharacterized protein YbjT (DUF2867 family)